MLRLPVIGFSRLGGEVEIPGGSENGEVAVDGVVKEEREAMEDLISVEKLLMLVWSVSKLFEISELD